MRREKKEGDAEGDAEGEEGGSRGEMPMEEGGGEKVSPQRP